MGQDIRRAVPQPLLDDFQLHELPLEPDILEDKGPTLRLEEGFSETALKGIGSS